MARRTARLYHDYGRCLSCGDTGVFSRNETIGIAAFPVAVPYASVLLRQWLSRLQGWDGLEYTSVARPLAEETADTADTNSGILHAFYSINPSSFLRSVYGRATFSYEKRLLVHVGIIIYVIDILCILLH